MVGVLLSSDSWAGRKKTKRQVIHPHYTQRQVSDFDSYVSGKEVYQGFKLLAFQVGYTIRDIGLPPPMPPKADFSEVLHTLLSNYTNHVHGWLSMHKNAAAAGATTGSDAVNKDDVDDNNQPPGEEEEGEGVEKGVKKGKDALSNDQSFQAYLTRQDPLLAPALTHLFYLAYYGENPLSAEELDYITLRIGWINQTMLLPGMKQIVVNRDYANLYSRYSGKAECLLPERTPYAVYSQGSCTSGKVNKEPEEEEDKGAIYATEEHRAYLKNHEVAEARTLSVRYFDAQEADASLVMQTVWEAILAYGRYVRKGVSGDKLLVDHVRFVMRLVRDGGFYKPAKWHLAQAWLRQMAIELYEQSVTVKEAAFTELSDSVLPVPLLLAEQEASQLSNKASPLSSKASPLSGKSPLREPSPESGEPSQLLQASPEPKFGRSRLGELPELSSIQEEGVPSGRSKSLSGASSSQPALNLSASSRSQSGIPKPGLLVRPSSSVDANDELQPVPERLVMNSDKPDSPNSPIRTTSAPVSYGFPVGEAVITLSQGVPVTCSVSPVELLRKTSQARTVYSQSGSPQLQVLPSRMPQSHMTPSLSPSFERGQPYTGVPRAVSLPK